MMEVRIDRSLVGSTGNSRRYVLVEVTAPEVPPREGRVPVNIALVLDRSGSMRGEKIRLAREAASQAIRLLRAEDRFSVVAYDDVVDVLIPSTSATPEAREDVVRRIQTLEARSCTNLSTGWLTGCEQVAAHLRNDAIGKVLLLSDGLANRGITDLGELSRHARELRSRGVLTSTFGIGADFDEHLMQALATEGAGHYYFIETPGQIPDLLTSELGETLEIVARDVEIFVGVPAGARAEILHTYPATQETRGVRCQLGNLVSGQQITAIFAVTFPRGERGSEAALDVTLTDAGNVFETPSRAFALRYASKPECDRQQREVEVDRAVAAVYAERARLEALEANRGGDYTRARQTLSDASERIRQYAGDDPAMLQTIERLQRDEQDFGKVMDRMSMKRRFSNSEMSLKSRAADGKSRRKRDPVPDAEVFALDTTTGHPIADINGTRCLLDTGSPTTFGSESFNILGQNQRPEAGLGPIGVADISRLIGARVDVLLGLDVLTKHPWVIDWEGNRVSFYPENPKLNGNSRTLPVTSWHGALLVVLEVANAGAPDGQGGVERRAFLDTGAKLSYIDPADVDGAPPDGEEDDFFPMIGGFRVPIYRRAIRLTGLQFAGTFGVLPEAFRTILSFAGANWILGNEILRNHKVLFDLSNERILFGERQAR